MNSSWTTYRLEQCAEPMPCGYGFDLGEKSAEAPVIKVSNIAGDGRIYGHFEQRSFSAKDLETLLIHEDDLLVVKSSGSKANILSGKTAIVRGEHVRSKVATNFLLRLQPKTDVVDPRLLWYILNNSKTKAFIKTIVGTTTYPNLKWEQYRLFQFKLPHLSIQKQIVVILDKGDGAREKRRQANQLIEQFLQSAFLEMFGDPARNPMGWDESHFGDWCEELKYGTSVHCHLDRTKSDLPVLRIPNILAGDITLEELKFATLPANEVERLKLIQGDILFVRSNGNPDNIARCAVFRHSETFLFASYLIRARLRSSSKVLPLFVKYVIGFPSYRQVILKLARTTAGNYNINTLALRGLAIITPPLELQARFCTLLNKVEALRAKQKESEKELENLFNSLMQRAFKGELV